MKTRCKEPRREEDREALSRLELLSETLCPVHQVLQDETKEHRAVVCGKIADIKKIAEAAVPRWVFVFLAMSIFSVIGFFWHAMERNQDHIQTSIKEVVISLNKIENKQINIVTRMEAVEKRIDTAINGKK